MTHILMIKQKRGLAFYKNNNSKWTINEYRNILKYTGDTEYSQLSTQKKSLNKNFTNNKYIYDDMSDEFFMYPWSNPKTEEKDTEDLTRISYESIFSNQTIEAIINEI